MNLNLAGEIGKIDREIVSMKTNQRTGGDSALLYKQIYNPGVLRGDVKKVHTITCVTDVELDRAIFMPVVEVGVGAQYVARDALPLRDFSDTIVWVQDGMSDHLIDEGEDTSVFAAKGITIYSNVPFSIRVEVA